MITAIIVDDELFRCKNCHLLEGYRPVVKMLYVCYSAQRFANYTPTSTGYTFLEIEMRLWIRIDNE